MALAPRTPPCYGAGMTTIPHAYAIAVDPADIDFMGHVNNASYLKWVQEAVVSHWQKLAPADAVAAHLWVEILAVFLDCQIPTH